MIERYRAMPYSGHNCCFDASVVDETGKNETCGAPHTVCETWDMETAELIASALNAQEGARWRLEMGPAVVYQDANQNAPSAKDGTKAEGLEGPA